MSVIYSRPRIRMPKIFIAGPHHKKPFKNKIMILIILLCLFGISIILKGIIPIFNHMCLDKAKGIATIIVNEETTNVLKEYTYSDFVIIHKDDNGNILMLESNIKNMNYVISSIAKSIQTKIENIDDEKIYINIGTFSGINFFSGIGPAIPIRIATMGNVKTTVKSELTSQGINQTLHRLYLEIECEISILTPFNTLQETIINQMILAENIIVGNIPSSYYNLEGIKENQILELIK